MIPSLNQSAVFLCCFNSALVVGTKEQNFTVQLTQSCPTLGNPMDCSTPGFPVHHQLPKLGQTQVY